MKKAYYVGLDIDKNIFQVFAADEKGREYPEAVSFCVASRDADRLCRLRLFSVKN